MKARDFFIPFLTSGLIFCMVFFLSCASQSRVEGDEYAGGETPPETTAVAEIGETPSTETAPESGDLNPSAPVAEAAPTETPAPTDSTEDPFAGLENQEKPVEAPADSNIPADATKDLLTDTPPATDTPPTAEGSLPYAPETGTDTALVAPPPAPEEPSAPAVEPEPVKEEAAAPKKTKYSGYSQVPKIPTEAIHKKGVALNRFYFLRKGDTPKKVSNLIYQGPQKSKALLGWNGGTSQWKPGKVVYYSSPSQPDDSQMRSFYQEHGIAPDEYQVKRGDWLSRIATKKLGSPLSWKEIAIVNGMERPDAIEPGQKLAVYPIDLNGGAVPQHQAEVPREEAAPVVKTPEPETKSVASAPKIDAPLVEPSTPPAPVETPAIQAEAPPVQPPPVPETPPTPQNDIVKAKKSNQNFNISKLIEQNLFFIVIGGGVAVLLLALMAVSRKKKAKKAKQSFDDDEDFDSPKAKRK